MLKWTLQKIVGSKNQREVKRLGPVVARINEIEEAYQRESEEQLRDRVDGWKKHLHRYLPLVAPTVRELNKMEPDELQAATDAVNDRLDALRSEFPSLPKASASAESIEEAKTAFREIEENHFRAARAKYLDQIMPEAFAAVKNAARRLCGQNIEVCDQTMKWEMVHFDVQLIGGIALHRGMIAEMQTGEGKTLVATLPVFLNALTGLGVHVVTVNDYLARRDSEWMGAVFKYLGLTVGCIQSQMPPHLRREKYECDITYGTNAEFGFDYLRDNGMSSSKEEQVQRGHYFSIIDEVDSILIDEARTPLIISGPSTVSNTEQYGRYKPLIEQLVKRQNTLCNELAEEAKKCLEAKDEIGAGRALFKIKLGNPRNRQLMRFMEDPETRRLIEKTELSMYQDSQKRDLFAIKEELYYTIDEKAHDADLMEMGREFLSPDDPDAFVLPDLGEAYGEIDADLEMSDEDRAQKKEELQRRLDTQGEKMHSISQLLKAYCLYEKDVEYVVSDNKVIIVDENTGREMPGRRWSDGLHQAVEAKEGAHVEEETQTYATITIQNYFRLYEKLAGMTGTAETEAAEFHDIYKLDVLPIPTNKPNIRIDHNDQVFKTRREKYNAVVAKIQEAHDRGQPVLVGTASVEASELLGKMLKRAKIPCNILNAKFHRQEAEIVANAGQKGAVTVSTNMAGRGTDIKLAPGVPEVGGLFVIATERYESRRVDRQLRGRCSRQGDPGMSQFFISFEDDLMRNFAAAERMTNMMERFGMEDGEALEHKWLNKSVETAQKRVEQRNYSWRKRVLDFDDVMNKQREVVYGYRNEVINSENPRELIDEVIERAIPEAVLGFLEDRDEGAPDYAELLNWVNTTFPLQLSLEESGFHDRDAQGNADFVVQKVKETYELKIKHEDPELLDMLERHIILTGIDKLWQEHLYNMDALREGVHLRAQGQKDPLVEYKNEAYALFETLMSSIESETLGNLFRSTTNLEQFENFMRGQQQLTSDANASEAPAITNDNIAQTGNSQDLQMTPVEDGQQIKINLPKRRPMAKINRNEDCPCGSGKKFKKCCGRES
ncbi:preprotein translocase subunit SecA [Verrucomicrobiaceae bacterium 5K15]|uniref:Protein translocase subunit SecA n=1 Tax=Oceaniferula flava TaxID=2800421 RepID=A0AAE2VEW3_9BACT|nr:preprotein translocase subunit SecA [Oceaniferula flavus]MBK1856304.1 preprotein translocase subunit SecA [Oceaniferula flavus]MBM1137611.1 preprotein translocase subunit SecA [Oceaniferula flavus]